MSYLPLACTPRPATAAPGTTGWAPATTPSQGGPYVWHDRNPSLPGRHARRGDHRPPAAHRRDALASCGTGRRSLAGRAAGDDAGARPVLGERLRLARVRG